MTDSPLTAHDILARIADTLETRRPENGGDPKASYAA
jgi:phosphoribosyl-ATP pyrophosphohydrolase